MNLKEMEDKEQQLHNNKLAHELGISIDDLQLLEWQEDTTKDEEEIPLSLLIQFSDESPREILEKIVGLSDSNSINVNMFG